ncbi:MAG: hypothetical protein RIR00_1535 [Pseudomonadota bacterium]|jgi:glycosyltransferase involved in cell wall biosynthesis
MTPLLYILYCSDLNGTEQMALQTCAGLAGQYAPLLLAPPGPLHAEAQRRGVASLEFASVAQLFHLLFRQFMRHRRLAVLATGVRQSLLCHWLARMFGSELSHLHLVHGGSTDWHSYGRKARLLPLPLRFVTVSEFSRGKLVEYGCPAARVEVIENFIAGSNWTPRPPFVAGGPLRKVALLTRLEPWKRVDLLLAALERHPELRQMAFHVFGNGREQAAYLRRSRDWPNLHWRDFVPDAPALFHEFDLLLHPCGEEPFGLVVLEAMLCDLPVLVPDRGGSGALVQPELTGFHFVADDPESLAAALLRLREMAPATLNAVTAAARAALRPRFAADERIGDYQRVIDSAFVAYRQR